MLKVKGLCYCLVKSRKATTCALLSEPSLSTYAASSDLPESMQKEGIVPDQVIFTILRGEFMWYVRGAMKFF